MPLRCPACYHNVAVDQVRTSFRCANCNALIQSNFRSLRWQFILGGIAAEILLLLVFRMFLGSMTVALAVWSLIGGLAAVLIYYFVVSSYGQLRVEK
jgi:hypothetical protein